MEIRAESQSPEGHYMRGGTPGDLRFLNALPQFKVSDKEYERRQIEIGRLRKLVKRLLGFC